MQRASQRRLRLSRLFTLKQQSSDLAYLGFQATWIEHYRDATVMRFVTATGDGGLCVTGEAIASAAHYGRLVMEFEEAFAFVGRIKSR